MPTPHVSNEDKLARLVREKHNLRARAERAWLVFDVRLNYRAEDARIGSTEEIEHIISVADESGYALTRTETYAIPLTGAGAPVEARVHLLLIFHGTGRAA
jgi:hypothetical protein